MSGNDDLPHHHSIKTIDHVIPKVKGGNESHLNKVRSCYGCNNLKGALLPEEFAVYILHHLQHKTYFHFGKARLETILKNVNALVTKIEPYRNELFRNIDLVKLPNPTNAELILREHESKRKKEFLELIASFPPQNCAEIMQNYKGGKSVVKSKPVKPVIILTTDQQVKKFSKKFPHIFSLLENANPDLPRWIFDNVVNNKSFLSL